MSKPEKPKYHKDRLYKIVRNDGNMSHLCMGPETKSQVDGAYSYYPTICGAKVYSKTPRNLVTLSRYRVEISRDQVICERCLDISNSERFRTRMGMPDDAPNLNGFLHDDSDGLTYAAYHKGRKQSIKAHSLESIFESMRDAEDSEEIIEELHRGEWEFFKKICVDLIVLTEVKLVGLREV